MRKKGIIVTSDFGSHPGGNTMWYRGINTGALRQHLLYFDKIHWPEENILIPNQSFDGLELLLKENILIRKKVDVIGFSIKNYGAEKLQSALQVSAFLQNNKNVNEEWAIAQPTPNTMLPDEMSIDHQTVEVSLYKCLPTPKADTKVEDILEFKEKRSDELNNLRLALDEMYLEVIASKDIPRAKNLAIQKIEKNLSDIEKVANESRIKYFLSSFKANLNINNLAVYGYAGLNVGSTFGMPAVGTIFGALFSSIKFNMSLQKRPRSIPPKIKAYVYSNDVKKHL